MDVFCEFCVPSGRGLCVRLIACPEESTDCGVSECDHESTIMRRHWPTGAVAP
jgi:hypothetical protein